MITQRITGQERSPFLCFQQSCPKKVSNSQEHQSSVLYFSGLYHNEKSISLLFKFSVAGAILSKSCISQKLNIYGHVLTLLVNSIWIQLEMFFLLENWNKRTTRELYFRLAFPQATLKKGGDGSIMPLQLYIQIYISKLGNLNWLWIFVNFYITSG